MYMTSWRPAGGASPLGPELGVGNYMDEVQGGRGPFGFARALVEWMQQLPSRLASPEPGYRRADGGRTSARTCGRSSKSCGPASRAGADGHDCFWRRPICFPASLTAPDGTSYLHGAPKTGPRQTSLAGLFLFGVRHPLDPAGPALATPIGGGRAAIRYTGLIYVNANRS
jgi:hypothetical protein